MTDLLPAFPQRHVLTISDFDRSDIERILALAETYVDLSRRRVKQSDVLKGATLVTAFFEASTRTRSSFEVAGKRLGADVITLSVSGSALSKGETLLDTAATLNAMRPDILVVRHPCSGAVKLLSRKVDGVVINAGDGAHEHPTQALLDALTLKRRLGNIAGAVIAICGDIAHSRVVRSDTALFTLLGARVRLIGPPTLLPAGAAEWGAELFTDMREGLRGCDVVMMLRLQAERMKGVFVPSEREYFHFYGLDAERLALAKPGALVMHPGPMNRGVEIDSALADDPEISLITEQVEMGVAVRMAVLDMVSEDMVSEDTVSEDTVSEDTRVSGDTNVSGDIL